ncbi:Aste57867_22125 [Aphanomyces stellatus]|uniref:Aste57867_22125 protein n=1 Tax=Aphanomyces stellatus TaxID=120398 RepID=A0A485LLD7_9STRA|nr:hypothetical protein As57867_022056 [Aphanomyces stellatus]VFT98793.1 Aste57867_22125 [Aphanomyces stellatus]
MCLDTDTTCTYPAEKCRYVPLVPKTLALNPASVRATAAKLVAAIQQVATATTPTDTLQRHLQVAMTSSNDVFSDTVNLFWAAVVTGTKPKTLKAVPNFCNTPKFNPADGTLTAAWQANPCCNPLLAAFVCCVPQNVPNGVINVITGIQPAVVNAYCPLQSDLMLAFLNGAYVGLSTAQNAANALDVSIGNTTWTALDIISTTCQTNIPNAASVTCAVDSDCAAAVCSQSKCNVDPTTLVGACTVPWDDMIGCTVECFANNMDPLLLRYVKQDWGLTSASTATDFKNAFIATATNVECAGPKARMADIGATQRVYSCNSTCQLATMCDDASYMSYLRNTRDQSTPLDFTVPATCTANGGRATCTSYGANGACVARSCTFDSISSPCRSQSACINQCQLPLTAGGCAVVGGTWFTDATNTGQCCPPDAYFYAASGATAALCTYQTPNTPKLAYQVTDPICCAASNGTWFMRPDGTSACCFGRIITIQNGGVNQPACQTTVAGWDVASCLATCAQQHGAGCAACKRQSAAATCCGYALQTANQTACLAYQTCNNNKLTNAQCTDATPFCAQCNGNVCAPKTQPPTCLYAVSNAAACTAAGGTWDSAARQCAALATTTFTATDCVRSDICPNVADTSGYTVVPLYPRRPTTCLYGCYLPTVNQTTCVANHDYMWAPTYANGNGICVAQRNKVRTATACTAIAGIFRGATVNYFPGAFVTQDACAQGGCVGAPFADGWSSAQCTSSSFASCSMACSFCTSTTAPFAVNGASGCFSSDATYCNSVNTASTPCLVVDATSATACAALTSTTWQSCSQFGASSTCTDATSSVATALQCVWTTARCPTQATCVAQGTCNDGNDNVRSVCADAGWTYGDTCTATAVVTVTDTSTNATTTTLQSKVCRACSTVNGVCVASMSASSPPCPQGQTHPMGCRVYGVADNATCTGQGSTWYTRATSQAQCLAATTCRGPRPGQLSKQSAAECAKCGGTIAPLYKWTPGVWSGPTVQPYTWMASGAQLISVNQWKTTISSVKLSAALVRPMARYMSNVRAQEALLLYNAMTDVLATLACACGASASASCFGGVPTGSLVAQTPVFCGLNASVTTGFASAVITSTCPANATTTNATTTSSRRRLDDDATASSDTATIAWTAFPLGTTSSPVVRSLADRSFVASFTSFPLTPLCTTSQLSPLVVVSTQGVAIGQLLGPGQSFTVTSGSVSSVQLCLSLSTNVFSWDSLFDTLDVATYQGGVFTPLRLASSAFLSSSSDMLCFMATQNATAYFPIKRASTFNIGTVACGAACGATTSVCAYNATLQATQCLCRCGYSGLTCTTGCLNGCSNQGTCGSNNVCTCNTGFGGDDCSQSTSPACPTGAFSAVPCAGNGVCNAGTCSCNANFGGAACDQSVAGGSPSTTTVVVTPSGGTTPSGTPSPPSPAPTPPPPGGSNGGSPTPTPTPTPTPSPTKSTAARPSFEWTIVDVICAVLSAAILFDL